MQSERLVVASFKTFLFSYYSVTSTSALSSCYKVLDNNKPLIDALASSHDIPIILHHKTDPINGCV